MTTLLIFALLCYLVSCMSFLTEPSRTTIRNILAVAGVVLWILACLGAIILPKCLGA